MCRGFDEQRSFWFLASFRLSHRVFKPAPSPKPRQKSKILAAHRYIFSVNAPKPSKPAHTIVEEPPFDQSDFIKKNPGIDLDNASPPLPEFRHGRIPEPNCTNSAGCRRSTAADFPHVCRSRGIGACRPGHLWP